MDPEAAALRTTSYSDAMNKTGTAKVHPGSKEDGNEAALKEVVLWDADAKDGVGADASTKVEGDDEATRPKVPYSALFRYTTGANKAMLFLAAILGVVQGCTLPALLYLFGDSLDAFGDIDPADEINKIVFKLLVVGAVAGVTAFFSRWIFNDISGKVVTQIRTHFMTSLLRQEMEWHDKNPAAALEIRLNANIPKIKTALATKLALAFANFGTGVGGIGLAFWQSPRLAAVFFALMIPLVLLMAAAGEVLQDLEGVKAKLYEDAGIVGEEVLSLIRVVMTFGTYDRELERYKVLVSKTAQKGKSIGRKFGVGVGLPAAMLNLQYAVAFYYGGVLLTEANDSDSNLKAGHILTALFSMMMGSMMLAMTSDYFNEAGKGRASAYTIYEVIDRESMIDGLSEEGSSPSVDQLRGDIALNNVSFSYPSTPDQAVLDGLTLSVSRGKKIALVGHSGCGKSTVINLLMRFYTPKSGSIEIDDNEIETYNVGWLRQTIGLVQQMPTLLPGTIEDNVRLGKENATDEEVKEACRVANAADFIESFPDKYKTEVGSLGGKLSGGQKQRIAIARTLVANPRILLLDEATSALDSRSEAKFLELLEETKGDRTTIVIAHRLATVKDADEIVALGKGKVIERGTHDELVAKQGFYFNMLKTQEQENNEDGDEDGGDGNHGNDDDGESISHKGTNGNVDDIVGGESTTKAVGKTSGGNDDGDGAKAVEKVDDATAQEVKNYVWKRSKPFMGTIFLASLCGLVGGLGYGGTQVVLAMMIQKVLLNVYDVQPYTCVDQSGYWMDQAQTYVQAQGAFELGLAADPPDLESNVVGTRVFFDFEGNSSHDSMTARLQCEFLGCESRDLCWGCVPVVLDADAFLANENVLNVTGFYVAVKNCSDMTAVPVAGDYAISDAYATTFPTISGGVSNATMSFGQAYAMTPAGDTKLMTPLCIAFVVIFVVMAIGRYNQFALEFVAGEKLVAALRTEFYGVFLRKGAGYHDRHSPSELNLALAVGAEQAANFYAQLLPKYASLFGVLASGVGIAFYYCWRLGLVMLGGLPLMIVGGALENIAMFQNPNKVDPTYAKAQVLSGTIITNLLIITSLGRAKAFGNQYIEALKPHQSHMAKEAIKFGFYGMVFQLTVFGVFALAFWYAGEAMSKGFCDPLDAIAAELGILFAGFQAGEDAALLPDSGKALSAMAQAYKLVMDTQDDLDGADLAGNNVEVGKGKIEFKDVRFRYPTRPESEVLKGLSFTIEGGTTVAVVGASGGGKSTILGLLQKLYHPSSGQVLVDGIDIAGAQRDSLRSQLAVVPQEPRLFNLSVKDNISYRPHEDMVDDAVDNYIETAASASHATTFVNELQDKFDYRVGRFGSRLSGGQCQRIAIARSIFGPPENRKILLLDEATSALDNESEELVQKALEDAQKGRTTVIVAHRLSTIKDADKIIVLEEGRVAEVGTFAELSAKKGVFWSLYESAL